MLRIGCRRVQVRARTAGGFDLSAITLRYVAGFGLLAASGGVFLVRGMAVDSVTQVAVPVQRFVVLQFENGAVGFQCGFDCMKECECRFCDTCTLDDSGFRIVECDSVIESGPVLESVDC